MTNSDPLICYFREVWLIHGKGNFLFSNISRIMINLKTKLPNNRMLKAKREDKTIHKWKKLENGRLPIYRHKMMMTRKEAGAHGMEGGGAKDDKQNFDDLFFMFWNKYHIVLVHPMPMILYTVFKSDKINCICVILIYTYFFI